MENTENTPGQDNPSYQPPLNTGDQYHYEDRDLKITGQTAIYLREAAKWTKFLSILGLIGIGFYVLAMIFMMLTTAAGSLGPLPNQFGAFSIPYFIIMIIIMVIYALPIWWLYKFSTNLKIALEIKDQATLDSAFNFLKKHYKFIGIMTVIMIVFYILMVIVFIGGAVFMGLNSQV